MLITARASVALAEHGVVQSGRQRRSFTARGDVTPAEIRHRRNAGALSNDVWIADLPGKWVCAARLVTQCLAVAADRSDLRSMYVGFSQ